MKRILDTMAIAVILIAMLILWATFSDAHNLDPKAVDQYKIDNSGKQSYYFLVLLGNQNIFQFTEKSDCEEEAARLNKILEWRYRAVCVETRMK